MLSLRHGVLLGWLVASLVGAAPPVADSLLPNAGFEQATKESTWPDGWTHPKTGGTWKAENGNHFLRLRSGSPGETVMLFQQVVIPGTARALELTWRERITDLQVGRQAWFDARIMMDFTDAQGKKLPAPPAPYTRKSTAGWVDRSARFLVPEGARTLDFMPALLQVERGTFDLDDLVLRPIDPGPLQAAATAEAAAKQEKEAKQAEARRAKASKVALPGGSLVTNGDFETDAKGRGWPDDWGHAKGGTWEKEDGNHFLRLTAPAPGQLIVLYRAIDLPAGVKALQLTWRQRVTNLQPGREPYYDARIMLDFKDASGKKLSGAPSPPYTRSDTKGWVEKSTKFLVPENALSLELMPALFQVERGTFDLDDIVLKPADPAELVAEAKARAEEEKRSYVPPEAPNQARWPSELHVQGNQVLDSKGRPVWLQGVNAGGLESLAVDRHVMKSAQVAVDEWKANIIRLPINEAFWFGKTSLQKDGGAAYRENIDRIVTLVANRGAYLLLDLHRFRAPKQEHAEFWKDAAAHFQNHPAVLFDLFNEPHGIDWPVWKSGGFVSEKKEGVDESTFLTEEEKIKNNAGFHSIGMQALVDAVRGTGARNIVLASTLFWSNDLTGVANGYALEDKTGNGIMYAWHNYNWHKGWEAKVLPVAAKYPVLVGEVGADTHKMSFIPEQDQEDPYTWVPDMLGFIQKYKLHWTGWCFHPKATPVMISDWDYTPTPYWGAFAKEALAGKKFELKHTR